MKSKSWRCGIEVKEVNPAFTSLFGGIKFSEKYGLSGHHAAAACIARRGLGFNEKLPSSGVVTIPDGRGNFVALSLPERNQERLNHFLKIVSKKSKAVVAQHFRGALSSPLRRKTLLKR